MAAGPTQRSLKKLRDDGYIADVTEKWIPGANVRKDLFGFIDILAVKPGEVLGVQCTSYSNVSDRVKKIEGHENAAVVRDAGIRIEVHGWHHKKKGAPWKCRVVDLS